jgi:hypothetical protein
MKKNCHQKKRNEQWCVSQLWQVCHICLQWLRNDLLLQKPMPAGQLETTPSHLQGITI